MSQSWRRSPIVRGGSILAGAVALAAATYLMADLAPGGARAQEPLASPTNLEVVGELRPGTPNIPLLMVVQWSPVPGAESYELERAKWPTAGSARVYKPVTTLTPANRRPNGRIGFVDEAGFALAGGDCFRVRAARAAIRSEWSSTCLPVPPTSGAPPPPDVFQFKRGFSADLELTIVSWTVPPGFEGATFELWAGGAFVPLVVLPPSARPERRATVLFHRRSGCFVLKVASIPDIESGCMPLPTDLWPTKLETGLLPEPAALSVRPTGRSDAPVVVLWHATGGPTDILFRVQRLDTGKIRDLGSFSYAGARLGGDVLSVFDTSSAAERPCYRVTAISSAGETALGDACLEERAPGPPDAGNGPPEKGLRGDSQLRAMFVAAGLSLVWLSLALCCGGILRSGRHQS